MSASQNSRSSDMLLSPRTPIKQKSMRDLSTTTPLGGRPKTSGPVARVATVSLQPPARTSPGRGLTLRIGDEMAEFSKAAKAIQSAPVRPIRRLPAVPPPPVPSSTTDEAPSTSLSTPIQNKDATPRTKRALPCPPTPAKELLPTISTPPMERRRPLPIPIPPTRKVEPLHNDSSPSISTARSLPNPISITTPSTPKIPSPSLIATFPHPETVVPKTRRHHQHTASEKIPGKKLAPGAPRKLYKSRSSIDLTLDVIQLHRQFVVNRSPVCISLDCDTMSEDEYNEEICSTAVFVRDAPVPPKANSRSRNLDKHEKELHADCTWLLANRIHHHQKSSEARVTSKWMREKKGKRYTEEDFDNILNALRNL